MMSLKTEITESEYIDFGSLTSCDAWSGIASCFIVPLDAKVVLTDLPVYYGTNKKFGKFPERVRVF